ncbi:DUF6183 family protein [Actinophytocola algeriensis]|uniref:Uncharacterized protein n=1 Tax=Actinophytocola algeriensis TaxID=1768010 RepID=A0A7W7PZ25_9PSEU|nr:DUF6183 family protein [Actinophytocola algeriensis]MBB4903828.1 hypothetical protein [Actinophytocola algeriensis]MBE1477315.1 hypothetical protein [Actinophytocola algeriensis]
MLSALRGKADVRPYYAELDRWSSADEVPRLEELAHALLADPGHLTYDSVFDHVERLLALTPSASRAAAVVRLAARLPARRVRSTAALLATGQPASVLLSLDLPRELGACLVHELVLRGVPVGPEWRTRLAGHPLGELPLTPLPGETPPGETGATTRSELITAAGAVPSATRLTSPADITSAVTTWLTESNGRAEAAVFTVAAPLAATDVGIRTVESLGLDCLAGNGLALRRATLPQVVTTLFTAAADGGAYDRGQGGAYGRLAAWRSVKALAGGAVAGCAWWLFDAANDWFKRISWDLGVLCLRPGGRGIAVLATTDAD